MMCSQGSAAQPMFSSETQSNESSSCVAGLPLQSPRWLPSLDANEVKCASKFLCASYGGGAAFDSTSTSEVASCFRSLPLGEGPMHDSPYPRGTARNHSILRSRGLTTQTIAHARNVTFRRGCRQAIEPG